MVLYEQKVSISLLIKLCIGLSSAISFSADTRDITIYYTNDLHAHVTHRNYPLCIQDTSGEGLCAHLEKSIQRCKSEKKDVFFL